MQEFCCNASEENKKLMIRDKNEINFVNELLKLPFLKQLLPYSKIEIDYKDLAESNN